MSSLIERVGNLGGSIIKKEDLPSKVWNKILNSGLVELGPDGKFFINAFEIASYDEGELLRLTDPRLRGYLGRGMDKKGLEVLKTVLEKIADEASKKSNG